MDTSMGGYILSGLIALAGAGWMLINKLRLGHASTNSEVGHLARMDREAERHERRIRLLERRVRLLERRDALLVALCLKHDVDVLEALKDAGLAHLDEDDDDDLHDSGAGK